LSAINNVTLIGNLVDDPELRFTPSGIPMAKVRFAVNKSYKKGDEWIEETSFFGGTLWREQAEQATESLHKGDRVIVVGRLEQRSWETDQGDKRSIVEVAIDEIGASCKFATMMVNRISRQSGGGGGGGRATPPPPAPRDDYGPDEAPF
jgi:single-strand DNA-binding protein